MSADVIRALDEFVKAGVIQTYRLGISSSVEPLDQNEVRLWFEGGYWIDVPADKLSIGRDRGNPPR